MARAVDYPWASLKRAIDAAKAVDYLGGKATLEMCADKMGMSVGGGFKAIITSAVKFGLLQSSKGNLSTTELFKLIKYAYNEEEKISYYKQAFLSAPIFNEIYERFKGQKLPVELLDKLLIREFGVETSVASRVAKYFIEGAKSVEVLDEQNFLFQEKGATDTQIPTESLELVETEEYDKSRNSKETPLISSTNEVTLLSENDEYVIHIQGPGMNTKIVIKDEDDIDIVNLTINKIKKKLSFT